VHDGADVVHHGFEDGAVGDVGNDGFLVVGCALHRSDVGQAQMAPVSAEAVAQRGADGAGGTGDQHTVPAASWTSETERQTVSDACQAGHDAVGGRVMA
jgi:hypothetical protein